MLENQGDLIEHFQRGEFTLRDMHSQFKNVLKLGPVPVTMPSPRLSRHRCGGPSPLRRPCAVPAPRSAAPTLALAPIRPHAHSQSTHTRGLSCFPPQRSLRLRPSLSLLWPAPSVAGRWTA